MIKLKLQKMKITKREKEVIAKLAEGFTVKEVAAFLYVAPSTIETHKKNIYERHDIRNMAQLGVMAVRWGIVCLFSLIIIYPSNLAAQILEIDGTIKATDLANTTGKKVVADDTGMLQLDESDPAILELRDSTGDVRFRFDANQGLFQMLMNGDTIKESQMLDLPSTEESFSQSKTSAKSKNVQAARLFIQNVKSKIDKMSSAITTAFEDTPTSPDPDDAQLTAFDLDNSGGSFSIDGIDGFIYSGRLDHSGNIVQIEIEQVGVGLDNERFTIRFNDKSTIVDRRGFGGHEGEIGFNLACKPIKADQTSPTVFSTIKRPDDEMQTGHDGQDIFAFGPGDAAAWFRYLGFGVVSTTEGEESFISQQGVGQVGDGTEASTFGLLQKDKIVFGDGEGEDHEQIAIFPDPINKRWIVCGDVHIKGNATLTGTVTPNTPSPFHSGNPSKSLLKEKSRAVIGGNVHTDQQGYATVDLSEYFIDDFHDFRYQLTVIGSFSQAIIKKEINDQKFVIQSEFPNTKISWQVSALVKVAKTQVEKSEYNIEPIRLQRISRPKNYMDQID